MGTTQSRDFNRSERRDCVQKEKRAKYIKEYELADNCFVKLVEAFNTGKKTVNCGVNYTELEYPESIEILRNKIKNECKYHGVCDMIEENKSEYGNYIYFSMKDD